MKRAVRTLLMLVLFSLPLIVGLYGPAHATDLGTVCTNYSPGSHSTVTVCRLVYQNTSGQYRGQTTMTGSSGVTLTAYYVYLNHVGVGYVACNDITRTDTDGFQQRNTIFDPFCGTGGDGFVTPQCSYDYQTELKFRVTWPDNTTTGTLIRFSGSVPGC